MKRVKDPVFSSVDELMIAIKEEATQLEKMAKEFEGTYTWRYDNISYPRHVGTITSTVTYEGLEYNVRNGVWVVIKVQYKVAYDDPSKQDLISTNYCEYKLDGLTWIIGEYAKKGAKRI